MSGTGKEPEHAGNQCQVRNWESPEHKKETESYWIRSRFLLMFFLIIFGPFVHENGWEAAGIPLGGCSNQGRTFPTIHQLNYSKEELNYVGITTTNGLHFLLFHSH